MLSTHLINELAKFIERKIGKKVEFRNFQENHHYFATKEEKEPFTMLRIRLEEGEAVLEQHGDEDNKWYWEELSRTPYDLI